MSTPGRPQRNNADWFSHDKDMRNDKKILAVRRKFGLVGYGVFNMVLETLTDCDFYRYEWDEMGIELMASDFGIEPENLSEIINYMVKKLKLFTLEDGFLTSQRFRERMEPLENRRQRRRGQSTIMDVHNSDKDNYGRTKLSDNEFRTSNIPEKDISDVQNPHSIEENRIVKKRESQTRARARGSALSVLDDPEVAEIAGDITANDLDFPTALAEWVEHLTHHNRKPPSKPMILTHLAILRDQTSVPCEVIRYSIGRGYPMLYPDFDDRPAKAEARTARNNHHPPADEPVPPYLRPFDENMARSRAQAAKASAQLANPAHTNPPTRTGGS